MLDLLFKWTEVTGSLKGDEVRDMLFGRLFGLMSIVAAGMITRESTTTDDIVRILTSLHEMGSLKSYLAEVCHHVVINMLPYVSWLFITLQQNTHLWLFYSSRILNTRKLLLKR